MARILLVDDDPALLSALPQALSRRLPPCEILTADSCETALVLLREGSFDVVISDLLMCGGGGTILVETLERLGLCVPTIIMTGRLEWPGEKLPAAAVGIVRKPFDISMLAALVRGVMEKGNIS